MHDAINAEVESACWLDHDRLVVTTTPEEPLDSDTADALTPSQIGIWSIKAAAWTHRTTVHHPTGTLIPCDDRIIALHKHPRLIDPETGSILIAVIHLPQARGGVRA